MICYFVLPCFVTLSKILYFSDQICYNVHRQTNFILIDDNLLGFFPDAPFGTPELINSFKNMDKEFYLVEKDGKQFLVTITDEFIETRQLAKRITAEKFEIGNLSNVLMR